MIWILVEELALKRAIRNNKKESHMFLSFRERAKLWRQSTSQLLLWFSPKTRLVSVWRWNLRNCNLTIWTGRSCSLLPWVLQLLPWLPTLPSSRFSPLVKLTTPPNLPCPSADLTLATTYSCLQKLNQHIPVWSQCGNLLRTPAAMQPSWVTLSANSIFLTDAPRSFATEVLIPLREPKHLSPTYKSILATYELTTYKGPWLHQIGRA